ncbi:MFS transporter [Microbacterium sp.]|uniref:MFS transporter n=1 Tax=Microbacterium sp. TaxID=51671 RepID=UPI0039E22D88
MTNPEIRRWRLSLFAFMFSAGLGMAAWVTRTPAIRDAVEASTAQMGLLLLGASIGAMAGVLSSEPLLRRAGSRPIILLGGWVVAAGVAVTGVAAGLGLAAGVLVGLMLFGLGCGVAEVALNVDGAEVEKRLSRSVLPALHGCFSLGTLVGAVLGIVFTAMHVPVVWHLLGCALLMTAVVLWGSRGLVAGVGRTAVVPARATESADRRASVWRDPALLLLGVVLLALALAEGAAGDWLPLIMVDGLGLSEALGSAFYAAFAAVMTIGRFSGHLLIARVGKQGALLTSVVLSAAGIALVALVDHPAVVVAGTALWGLGASLGFPVAISVAGDDADRPAERVGAVATAGYLAYLVGPPVLGFLGEHYGLRSAILAVVGLLIVAAVAGVVRVRMRRPGRASAAHVADASR